jgi:hypothetical protein
MPIAGTREPTAAELAKVRQFIAKVHEARPLVERALNCGRAMRRAQAWIDARGYGAILPRVWTPATDGAYFEQMAFRATLLERYAYGLETNELFFRLTPDGNDIEIVSPPGESVPPAYALGNPLIIVAIVAGVLIVAAIAVAIGMIVDYFKTESLTKKKIAELDSAAAKAGGDVAKNWKAYKDQNAAADGSILAELKPVLSTVAIVGGLIALAVIGSKVLPQRKGAAA